MAFPVKQVWTLEERLCIIEEVEKTPSEKRIDIAKRLGLPPSTLNTIIVKKKEIRELTYMSVDQELATCGVLCVQEMGGELGSGNSVGEMQGGSGDDEAKPKTVSSFTETLCAIESTTAFMYAHDITKRHQANIINIESLLFSLKRTLLERSNAKWT
jgi:hypothetical protein